MSKAKFATNPHVCALLEAFIQFRNRNTESDYENLALSPKLIPNNPTERRNAKDCSSEGKSKMKV